MKIKVIIESGDTPMTLNLRGRLAWTLCELHRAGERGITSLHNPAPRLSHYIMTLRRKGFVIDTIRAEHGGPFPGHHGIYRLLTRVTVEQAGGAA